MHWTSCTRAYVHTPTVRCGLVLKTLELEFPLTALQRDAFKSARPWSSMGASLLLE